MNTSVTIIGSMKVHGYQKLRLKMFLKTLTAWTGSIQERKANTIL